MTTESATLGGGCFWCLEAVYEQVEGVDSVRSGYAGGHLENPTYEAVCGGNTGHAEVVQVEYDPQVISYSDLLEIFFGIHDPTTKDRQGNDVGSQYRSAILVHSQQQRQVATALIARLEGEDVFEVPIVTTIESLDHFWPAEAEHAGYFRRNPVQPYCMAVVGPKVAKFRQRFAKRLRS